MDNAVEKLSFSFAVRIVKLYKYLTEEKREFVLSKQLLRCGTSIGANVSEAQEAQSKLDFVSKMSIALKEATETMYWLRLMEATGYLTKAEFESVSSDCREIQRLLTSIIRTSKNMN